MTAPCRKSSPRTGSIGPAATRKSGNCSTAPGRTTRFENFRDNAQVVGRRGQGRSKEPTGWVLDAVRDYLERVGSAKTSRVARETKLPVGSVRKTLHRWAGRVFRACGTRDTLRGGRDEKVWRLVTDVEVSLFRRGRLDVKHFLTPPEEDVPLFRPFPWVG